MSTVRIDFGYLMQTCIMTIEKLITNGSALYSCVHQPISISRLLVAWTVLRVLPNISTSCDLTSIYFTPCPHLIIECDDGYYVYSFR